MDQSGKRNPRFPASENNSDTTENNSDTPRRRNGYIRSLESVFSGLRLEGGGDRVHTMPPPSFRVLPPVESQSPAEEVLENGDEFLMRFRAQEIDGPYQNGIHGAHQNLNVGHGPETRMMMNHLPVALPPAPVQPWCNGQDFYTEEDYMRLNYEVANYNGCTYNPYLQNTVPVMHRELISQLPIVPLYDHGYHNNYFPRNRNFGTPNAKNTQSGLMGSNELRGNIVALAKDQQGSKLLQAKLEKGSEQEIETVFSELIDYVGDLLKNQPGSYVIQKLFAVCNEEQRTIIIQAITRNTHQFIGICFSQHGAKAIQKLWDNVSTPQQTSLILSAITPVAVALANDQSGQHVIQYCVKTFSIEYTRHLLNEIANNCFAIATQKSGCCVIQSCVESARGKLRDRLITEILANAVQLSEDQYGNYVVQHLVVLKLPGVTDALLDRLQGNFVTLSCNKYASNVVEKVIVQSGEKHSTRIITELLTSSSASMLLVDPYGNFVIQTALQVSQGYVFDALCKLIWLNSASMQSNLYGKKILDRVLSKKEPLHCTRFYRRQEHKAADAS
ncbi:unnamed protein product [Withania somnifera]